MEPNHGCEVAGFRVRLVRKGLEPWSWSIADVMRAAVAGPGWELLVSSSDAPDVLAHRTFARRRDAQEARDEFVRLAANGVIDVADSKGVRRALSNI